MLLVLDNNSLFSIINPKSISAYLFSSIKAKFIAPEFIKSEFEKYKEIILFKSKLSEHEFEIRQKEIEESIEFIKVVEYEEFLKIAKSSISDPDDIDFLALALLTAQKGYSSSNSAIWSNDPHLKEQSLIPVFTTFDLVKMFLKGEI